MPVVDILDPEYFISEIFGSALVFAVVLTLFVVWLAAQKKFPFQITVALLVLAFLMLGIIFPGFVSWIPLILVVVGIIVGTIFFKLVER